MKKAALILSAALLLFFSPSANAYAAESAIQYVYFSSDTELTDESGAAICTLPATYFGVAEGVAGSGRIPVSYLDIRGYVPSSCAQLVDYEPVTKFASLTATPDNDGMAVNLRDKPNAQTGKVLCAVPNGARLTLYGSATGGELFAGAGHTWQYVRYDGDTSPRYGYVYAPQLRCDEVVPNKIEKVVRPTEVAEQTETAFKLGGAASVAVAVAMCVPAGIIMLILFYRPDSKRIPRHSRRSS